MHFALSRLREKIKTNEISEEYKKSSPSMLLQALQANLRYFSIRRGNILVKHGKVTVTDFGSSVFNTSKKAFKDEKASSPQILAAR